MFPLILRLWSPFLVGRCMSWPLDVLNEHTSDVGKASAYDAAHQNAVSSISPMEQATVIISTFLDMAFPSNVFLCYFDVFGRRLL